MSDALLIAIALVAAISAMASFALSITAHWRQVAGDRSHPAAFRIGLRIVGGSLLLAAFLICAAADPISMAMLVWPMLLTVGAIVVAFTLTIHARFQRKLSSAIPPFSVSEDPD